MCPGLTDLLIGEIVFRILFGLSVYVRTIRGSTLATSDDVGGLAMSNATYYIFISYRRQEANWLAALLHDHLAARFGGVRVFLDIDWIKPGVDFMQIITEAVGRSSVLL